MRLPGGMQKPPRHRSTSGGDGVRLDDPGAFSGSPYRVPWRGEGAGPPAEVMPRPSWMRRVDPRRCSRWNGRRRSFFRAGMKRKSGGDGLNGFRQSAANAPSFHQGKAFHRRLRPDCGEYLRQPAVRADSGVGGSPHPGKEGRGNHSQSVAPWAAGCGWRLWSGWRGDDSLFGSRRRFLEAQSAGVHHFHRYKVNRCFA